MTDYTAGHIDPLYGTPLFETYKKTDIRNLGGGVFGLTFGGGNYIVSGDLSKLRAAIDVASLDYGSYNSDSEFQRAILSGKLGDWRGGLAYTEKGATVWDTARAAAAAITSPTSPAASAAPSSPGGSSALLLLGAAVLAYMLLR